MAGVVRQMNEKKDRRRQSQVMKTSNLKLLLDYSSRPKSDGFYLPRFADDRYPFSVQLKVQPARVASSYDDLFRASDDALAAGNHKLRWDGLAIRCDSDPRVIMRFYDEGKLSGGGTARRRRAADRG